MSFILLASCGDDSQVKSLIEASAEGDVEQMSRLIDQGANANGVALDGWSPITRAANAGQMEAVKLLQARGADIGDGPVTPLYWAAFWGHVELAKFLLERGGRLNLNPKLETLFLDQVNSHKNEELTSFVNKAFASERQQSVGRD